MAEPPRHNPTRAAGHTIREERSTDRSSHRFRSHRFTQLWIGLVILLVLVAVAVFAPQIAPHNPNAVQLHSRLTPPAWENQGDARFPLGTDQLGRDILSRIIYGSRVSMLVGLLSVLAAGILGTVLGLLAGYYGGFVGSLIMRITDMLMALPFILLALMVTALLGPTLRNVIVVFTITSWYVYTRLANASTLSLRQAQYVEAARATGDGTLRILLRHILPNLLNPLIVMATFEIGRIITAEAALGFLGLGVPPPAPSWGNMLADGREYIQEAWWIATLPGMVLMVTVLGMNLLGDGLRDYLDPSLRRR